MDRIGNGLETVDQVLERIEQQKVAERLDISAHEVLKSIYQDPNQPIGLRCRAAIKAIEVETPKVMAVAVGRFDDGQTFAEALERATARSETVRLLSPPKVIEHSNATVLEPLVTVEEMKKPFPTHRRF